MPHFLVALHPRALKPHASRPTRQLLLANRAHACTCCATQAIVALPAYLFVETFQQLLPVALGFAAGCMVSGGEGVQTRAIPWMP